ncbi:hypothetical protein [Microvirga soli]|uniref:hypothetical protein n=1 Tax=Microvirga soli TaxID=1854496 RepID=UPI00191DE2C0|nr:hypothetical protein [Microvirga soli]
MSVWNGEELAWAALVALGIGWDAHEKFRRLLGSGRPDEWDMSPVWERRIHRWRGIGLATSSASILFVVARIIGRTVA